MKGQLELDDGSPTDHKVVLDSLDVLFTWTFTVELFFNLYARWMHDFISDGWCLFDFFVVAISHISNLLPQDGEGAGAIMVFRLLRAFRVLRIFGRLKSIRAIINALSASLIPVANAFFIMAIVLMLYAIICTTILGDPDRLPEEFGTLDRSVISLFRVAAGETWVGPEETEDGSVD
jgi:hypothetical protein